MNEEEQKETAAGSGSEQVFRIEKIFVKDLSLESPNAPEMFRKNWEPNVNIELNSQGRQLEENVHEIVLGITVTVKLAEEVAYLVEVQQAGIFSIVGFKQAELGAMLGSYCPNLLYPFAREVISDMVTKAGFPQMLLAPVNFDAIYQDHLRRQEEQKDAGSKSGTKSIH